MKFRGKGCSPETAQKIATLILRDEGAASRFWSLLGSHRLDLEALKEPAKPRLAPISPKTGRSSRKLVPPVVAFLHAHREIPIPELLERLKENLGVSISAGSVYKAWRISV